MVVSLCHWGAFEAVVENGRLVAAHPLGGANPQMIGKWPDLVYSDSRITQPHVRRGFLEKGHGAGGAGRGTDEMVPVAWDTALDLAAAELARVHREHGAQAVFGGSYGWSSAGRFHHARTQVRRFLAAAGGFTDVSGNYSWGAAQFILPHVLGDDSAVSSAATDWATVADHADTVVAFGGLNPKNWRVTSGGAVAHHLPEAVRRAADNGVSFTVVSPLAQDVPPGLNAALVQPRPGSDTAIILALCHKAVITGRADRAFLNRFTVGAEPFIAYLRGDDGTEKTLEWAAGLADVPLTQLEALWNRIATGRVMLTASWSLQRADHGEQPYWALVALAAMLGQIGLPGGGFCFGYGSMNGVGAAGRRGFVPAMEGLPNPVGTPIPVACFPEALANPGRRFAFNGTTVIAPDIRLIWWAGGNPFHHAQDLNALEKAWQRPETVIVHDPWWTPTAQRADIVFPSTTTLERNDIGGTSRDLFVIPMPRVIAPVGQARDDFATFGALADRLGCRAAFDDGRDEMDWLRHMWARSQARGITEGVQVAEFDEFFANGPWPVPPEARPEVLLQDFRDDPLAHPLATPSGRIEISSQTIAGFGLADCPGHPAWLEPVEWLGAAAADDLHLVTNQPARQLHSQLWQVGDQAPQPVHMNPEDAAARGLRDGDGVRLFNHRGACFARLVADAGLRRGVVVMATGAWFAPDKAGERNGNPNVLTAWRQTSSLAQACAALSTLVKIEKETEWTLD
ncbi:molybdopterin-dependent oxidoreductase [Oceaniglobus trochenteri]|uniref:molybdopterin-dependent oxidoreductase n=1 Tax=Oceaniglobus trochenteri TaxID=2763260 RepID=UPI001CFF7BFF|nr:molybdopterin-dependent oxidoreductase [Oceaniglobus trochenteri]